MKKVFIHGTVAGVTSATVAIIYNISYSNALFVDFSKVVNPVSITSANIFGCLLASLGYYFFAKKVTRHTDVWFNIIFLLLSFASFASPFATHLPLDIQSPELFPGLAIPMHIFPVLLWIATKPLFDYKDVIEK